MGRGEGDFENFLIYEGLDKKERAGVSEDRLIPQCTHTHTQRYIYIYIYIRECKNWRYVEQVQRVKWYVSQEAGSKASKEDLCVMLDKVFVALL